MRPETARILWQLLEPYHALVYFAPEAKPTFEEAGLKGGWMGYFASRAAAMGPVPAEVVIATFYNFHPNMVRRAIPDAWRLSTPERILEARRGVADVALRRLLGDGVASDEVSEAGTLARRAAEAADPAGRPLFAAHAALPWPEEPHLVLWHAATLLREFRGDGHVASLLAAGIDGCAAHVTMVAAGRYSAGMIRGFRGWSEEEWDQAVARLRKRGWLDGAGAFTEAGRAAREEVERRTDELALPPFEALGEEGCDRLALLMQAIHRRMEHDGMPFPNPVGVPRPA
jgi:hypothetical protein